MNFEEYQKKSRKTAVYPKIGESFVYPALGLGDEAGEVLGKIKKIFRDKNGVVDEATKKEIKKELGDVLWYLSQLSTELDLSLDDIAQANIEKLQSRLERGTLHGNGDNR
jgi:NTP pyrophosphatase (non-canonical NTP hydrolase)